MGNLLDQIQFGLGALGIIDQNAQTEEAKAANELRYNQLLRAMMGSSYTLDPTVPGNQAWLETRDNPGVNVYGEGVNLLNLPQIINSQASEMQKTVLGDQDRNAAELSSMYQNLIKDLSGSFNRQMSGSASQYQNIDQNVQAAYNTLLGDLRGQYADRQTKAMGMLEGAGQQEAADIRESWRGQASQGMQDLASRGLSGTTIAPSMQAGYQREENADLGRLNDRLREDKINLYTGLTGDWLGTQAGLGSQAASASQQAQTLGASAQDALRQSYLNMLGQTQTSRVNDLNALNANRAALNAGILQTRDANILSNYNALLGTIANREDVYPDQSMFTNMMQLLGNAQKPTVKPQTDWWTPTAGLLGSGAQAFGTYAGLAALA